MAGKKRAGATKAIERVQVVAAIICGDNYGKNGQILIAKRVDHLHQGGLWEFPGGKVDAGESPRQALVRELREELAIETTGCQPYMEIRHDYPDRQVQLDFWKVTDFDGDPVGNEGQPIEWVEAGNLVNYPFPEANQAVVDSIVS